MIRALLAATALTTSMSMAALAQDTDTSTETDTEMDTQVEAPMDSEMDSEMGADAETNMEMDSEADDMVADDTAMDTESSVSLSAGYMQSDEDFLGSRILGATVWNSSAEDAETIGDINDVIFNSNGRMIAAIIGIGGFLEIGEKSVAVGFEELEWTTDINGDPRLVLTGATYESLEAAPEFVWEMPELAADPMMTEMDTGVALDAEAPMDAAPVEGDAETDAMMGAEGDTTMDTNAETPAEDMEAEGNVDGEVEVDAEVSG